MISLNGYDKKKTNRVKPSRIQEIGKQLLGATKNNFLLTAWILNLSPSTYS